MKKMSFVITMLFAVTTSLSAQYQANSGGRITVPQDIIKNKINPTNLPEAVKQTLSGESFSSYTIAEAWEVKEGDVYYNINLVKNNKTKLINIDRGGKVK